VKVGILFFHPFSESMGSAVRVRELSFSLAKMGLEVYIYTPYEKSRDLLPNVHIISLSALLNNLGISRKLYKFSKFIYYSKTFPKVFSSLGLQSNFLANGLVEKLNSLVVKNGIDILQVEQDAVLPIGTTLKRTSGLPLVADIHNISSEELVAVGVFDRESEKFREMQSIMSNGLSKADHAVVVSAKMRQYLIDNYSSRFQDVTVVPPGGRLGSGKIDLSVRMKTKRVVYAGLVSYRERVDLFVKSMPYLLKKKPLVEFYITNKGECVKAIRKLSSEAGVCPNFFWYDGYGDVNRFLASCNVGVLPSSNDLARQMGTPAKLFNYLSVGLPVVANDIGGWSEIISKEKVGLLTSDDPEEFGDTLANLMNSPEILEEYAVNGLNLVKDKYNWDESAKKLISVYSSLAG
jgi:glycosyltransferase involved in cell wall biosynthesis